MMMICITGSQAGDKAIRQEGPSASKISLTTWVTEYKYDLAPLSYCEGMYIGGTVREYATPLLSPSRHRCIIVM